MPHSCSILYIFIIDYYSHYVLWKDFFSLAPAVFGHGLFFCPLCSTLTFGLTKRTNCLLLTYVWKNFLLWFQIYSTSFQCLACICCCCVFFNSFFFGSSEPSRVCLFRLCYCWILNNSCIKMIFLWWNSYVSLLFFHLSLSHSVSLGILLNIRLNYTTA